jgi:acetyl-CoA carboxylase / biotin carboxylase 1
MYAAKGTARGGVLEAAGAASVKYRSKDLLATMHRLDRVLIELDSRIAAGNDEDKNTLQKEIAKRESMLMPVYEQISVLFCDLHDRTGRMKAVGVIRKEVEWEEARSFFYWRLRRKLAEFDLRRQLIQAAEVGRGVVAPTPVQATETLKAWFLESKGGREDLWDDDKAVLSWMADSYSDLEQRILSYTKEIVIQEVVQVMTAGGNTARIGTAGIVEGLERAMQRMDPEQKQQVKQMLLQVLNK